MNTEIFDYIKALSKKEFFWSNFFSSVLSVVIIVAGAVSLYKGTSIKLYTIMFASATLVMLFNTYKSYKRGSKNGVIFVIMSVIMGGFTLLGLYAMFKGGM